MILGHKEMEISDKRSSTKELLKYENRTQIKLLKSGKVITERGLDTQSEKHKDSQGVDGLLRWMITEG